MQLVFLFILSFLSLSAYPFPEMVRHGYQSCRACHVSPDGGGVLTAYGRTISGELLSHGSYENEGELGHGLVTLPENLDVGGDVRFLQAYENNQLYQRTKFFLMQADGEVAVSFKKFVLDATAGISPAANGVKSGFLSRRHFILFQLTPEIGFRLGKFMTPYGLKTADHVVSTRRGLGFDPGRETYNAEFSWSTKTSDLFIAANLGRPDSPELPRESGFSVRATGAIDKTYKIGGGYYYGKTSTTSRHVMGPLAVLGFTPELFLLSEFALQSQGSHLGVVSYHRLDWEFLQGFHVFLHQEFSQLQGRTSRMQGYGLGVQIFPRPHFEIAALWQKQKAENRVSEFGDYAWVLLHYYL